MPTGERGSTIVKVMRAVVGLAAVVGGTVAALQPQTAVTYEPFAIRSGHDPQVFVRFPSPGNGVARLQLSK